MQKLIAAKVSQDDEIGTQLLKCASYIGKRELPKEEMKHLVDFGDFMGLDMTSKSCFKALKAEIEAIRHEMKSSNETHQGTTEGGGESKQNGADSVRKARAGKA